MPCTKATRRGRVSAALLELSKPMVGIFPVCCARAVSGQPAAAPPSNAIILRRLINAPTPTSYRTATFVRILRDLNDANPARCNKAEPSFRLIRYSRLITNRLPAMKR
jgi:hypothetical protein